MPMLAARVGGVWVGSGRVGGQAVERVKGIEPSYEAWEAAVLPLNYTRKGRQFTRRSHEPPTALAGCGVREETADLRRCGEARVLALGRPNSGPGGGEAVRPELNGIAAQDTLRSGRWQPLTCRSQGPAGLGRAARSKNARVWSEGSADFS